MTNKEGGMEATLRQHVGKKDHGTSNKQLEREVGNLVAEICTTPRPQERDVGRLDGCTRLQENRSV